MNVEQQSKETEDITCEHCGKTNEQKPVGTSWICEDCKVSKVSEQPSQQDK